MHISVVSGNQFTVRTVHLYTAPLQADNTPLHAYSAYRSSASRVPPHGLHLALSTESSTMAVMSAVACSTTRLRRAAQMTRGSKLWK